MATCSILVMFSLGFQLSGAALQKLSAFTVNLAFNLEPVYGILLAFVVYREDQLLSKWFYLGFCLIMAALLIHMLLLHRKKKQMLDPIPVKTQQ